MRFRSYIPENKILYDCVIERRGRYTTAHRIPVIPAEAHEQGSRKGPLTIFRFQPAQQIPALGTGGKLGWRDAQAVE